MATITSAQSGNFSDTATWVGGVVPGASDDAVAATGHTVTIDVDVTVLSVTQAGTGKFVLGDGRTLTGNVIANAGTFTSGGTVEVTATTGNTATINGNVTGVSSTAVNVAGVVVTGTGALVLNGNVTGSAGNNSTEANGSASVYTNVNSTITINGAVTGGSGANKRGLQVGTSSNGIFTIIGNIASDGANGHGVLIQGASATLTVTGNITGNINGGSGVLSQGISTVLSITGNITGGNGGNGWGIGVTGSSSAVTITGNVNGGGGANSHGVYHTGTSATVTITATTIQGGGGTTAFGLWHAGASGIINTIGNVQATSTSSHGVRSDATANGVIHQGDLTDSPQGARAVYARIFRMSATNSGVTRYANTVGFPSGTLVSRVSPDNVTGMAQTADVRKNTVYGYNNELTGTMAVPSAQSVAYGVPVDGTVGSAVFDLGQVAEAIGLQVAAGKSV